MRSESLPWVRLPHISLFSDSHIFNFTTPCVPRPLCSQRLNVYVYMVCSLYNTTSIATMGQSSLPNNAFHPFSSSGAICLRAHSQLSLHSVFKLNSSQNVSREDLLPSLYPYAIVAWKWTRSAACSCSRSIAPYRNREKLPAIWRARVLQCTVTASISSRAWGARGRCGTKLDGRDDRPTRIQHYS